VQLLVLLFPLLLTIAGASCREGGGAAAGAAAGDLEAAASGLGKGLYHDAAPGYAHAF
jgi:hypothetical protein